jgi:hypothetical protein
LKYSDSLFLPATREAAALVLKVVELELPEASARPKVSAPAQKSSSLG